MHSTNQEINAPTHDVTVRPNADFFHFCKNAPFLQAALLIFCWIVGIEEISGFQN